MPTSKKPRKKYRPKDVFQDPLAYVINGFRSLSAVGDEAVKLKIKAYDALNTLRTGHGKFAHLDQVATALNIADALSLGGEIGKDYSTVIRAGQDALFSMAERGAETGRFLFTGPELQATNEAMEVYAAQMDVVTVAELQTALHCVVQLTNRGKCRKLRLAAC